MHKDIIKHYYKDKKEQIAALAVYRTGTISGWLTMGAFTLFTFGVFRHGLSMHVEAVEIISSKDLAIDPEQVKILGDALARAAAIMTWWFLAAFAPGRYLRGLRAKGDVRISLWLSLILTLPFFFTGIGAIYTIACIIALRRLGDYVSFDEIATRNSE